jgi:hypothetical protein
MVSTILENALQCAGWFQEHLEVPCSLQEDFKNTWKSPAACRKTSRSLESALQCAGCFQVSRK